MNKNIILGGGCFWCTEAIYKYVNGVVDVIPGYIGGSNENPTYEKSLYWKNWTCRGCKNYI